MSTRKGVYEHVRCPVCGVPWHEHTAADCSRHKYRDAFMCTGFAACVIPGHTHPNPGRWQCCVNAGRGNGSLCAVKCRCHGFRGALPSAPDPPGGAP